MHSASSAKSEGVDRITTDPLVMGGKPCIRGMRITVGAILGMLASGKTASDVLATFPHLAEEDVRQSLAYAAWRMQEHDVALGPG